MNLLLKIMNLMNLMNLFRGIRRKKCFARKPKTKHFYPGNAGIGFIGFIRFIIIKNKFIKNRFLGVNIYEFAIKNSELMNLYIRLRDLTVENVFWGRLICMKNVLNIGGKVHTGS